MKVRFTSITVPFLMVLTALAMQANTANGQPVEDIMVPDSHWTFDEADIDGATVKDVWGGRDGEIIGDPQIVAGKFGSGIELDGVDDNVNVSTLDISPSVHPDLTLMAWVYPTSTGEGGQGNRRFLFGHDDGGWDRGLLIEGSNWRLGTGFEYWDTGIAVELNTWQHVAMVYDATDIKFYRDGVQYSYGSAGTLGDGHPFLLIGTHPSQARFFQGIIDEVYAYGSVLSEIEIGQTMEGTVSAVTPAMKLSITWGEIKASK